MVNKDIKAQVKAFLSELNDTRHEYGFSANEEWTLDLATIAQKKALENKYYPVLSLTIAPENVMETLTLLQEKLGNAVTELNEKLNPGKIAREATNLLAYCVGRLK